MSGLAPLVSDTSYRDTSYRLKDEQDSASGRWSSEAWIERGPEAANQAAMYGTGPASSS